MPNDNFNRLVLLKRPNVAKKLIGYLRYQMSTFINARTKVTSTTWKTSIYRSLVIGSYPVDEIDCMNQCLNVDFGNCFRFVYESGTCYLGRPDLTTGSVAASFNSVTLYNVISNFCYLFLDTTFNASAIRDLL